MPPRSIADLKVETCRNIENARRRNPNYSHSVVSQIITLCTDVQSISGNVRRLDAPEATGAIIELARLVKFTELPTHPHEKISVLSELNTYLQTAAHDNNLRPAITDNVLLLLRILIFYASEEINPQMLRRHIENSNRLVVHP